MITKIFLTLLTVCLASGVFFVSVLPAQDQPAPGTEPPKTEAAGQTAAPSAIPVLLNQDMDWVISDICRLVEEIRKANNQWEMRDLVEQIEFLIYEHLEYPILFKQAEVTDNLDLNRIGTVSDIVDAGMAHPLATQLAEAYGLYAVAKGYEGFAAAANDQLTIAKNIYPDIEDLSVKIDNFQDPRTIKSWMTDSMGAWAKTNTVRVTFLGKNVRQSTIDALNNENVFFEIAEKKVDQYYLNVAQYDFLRGLRTYIATDDRLKERRPNKFNIYLPTGTYKFRASTTSKVPVELKVTSDPEKNQFIVESLEQGVTCYPLVDVQKPAK